VKPPISFVYGNCVFGEGLNDGWAAFAVTLSSYAWLGAEEKRARFLTLVGALESVEADIQLLRVSGRWDLARYEADGGLDGAECSDLVRAYVKTQVAALEESWASSPALYVLVSLREPEQDVASYLSRIATQRPNELWRGLRGALAARHGGSMATADLERARLRADRIHARLSSFLDVRPARSIELQWLVRRAFCRGLGEPDLDGLHEPRAMVFERNGEAVLAPLEGDVLRWFNSEVEHRARLLGIESELGRSWQALLTMGAVPDRVEFPGPRAELLFGPPEAVPFGLDIAVTSRFLPNDLALRLARRKIQDADQILRAESSGEQGVSDLGYERTQEARDLLAHLQSSSRPPLFRATVSIVVSAASELELESRVEATRPGR
jgi:hypothetical protein